MKTPLKLTVTWLFLITHCGKEDYNPVVYGNDFVHITPQQQWVYRETYIYDKIVNYLDTTFAYAHFRHTADTVIDGLPYLTIDETTYSVSDFSVDTGAARFYMHIGADTLYILWAKDLIGGTISNLFKVKSSKNSYHNNTVDTVVPPFDTSRFCDLTYAMVFPLTNNLSWKFRPLYQGIGSIPVQRTYVGDETVTVPGGTFFTWKLKWNYLDSVFETTLAGTFTDWVSETGIVKRIIDFSPQTQYDIKPFETDSIGIYDPYFLSEYIGTVPVSGEFLKPLLPATVIDSVKRAVKIHWSYVKFADWCVPYIRGLMHDDSTELIGLNDNMYGIDELLKSIWGGNERTCAEVITMLSTSQLPREETEFDRYDHFLYFVLNLPVTGPGWIDCEADTSDPAAPDLVPPSHCSSIRDNLRSYVYDGK